MEIPGTVLLPVTIRYSGHEDASGQVEVHTYSAKERMHNGLKWLGIFWGLALFSVFLPLLHFLLVPLFFIMGPAVALFQHRQTSRILGGKGVCPACKAELIIVKGPVQWPLEEVCSSCWRKSLIMPATT